MKTLKQALTLVTFCLMTLLPLTGWAQSVQMVDDSTPVRWHRSEIDFVVDPSLEESGIENPVRFVQRIAETWEEADANVPHFQIRPGSLGEPGYDEQRAESDNHSGIRLYHHGFPNNLNRAVLALTLLTRNRATGEIVDTDIMIDAEHNRFEILASPLPCLPDAPNDFQNVVTHEFGHALGLVEDQEHPDATMFPSSQPGEVSKRDITESDRASIALAYHSSLLGTVERSKPLRALMILAGLLLAFLVIRGSVADKKAKSGFAYIAAALLLLTVGYPSVRPQTTEHGLVVATRSFWSGGLMRTVATVQTAHGLTRVERLGGRIGTLEQRVLDAPSGHELQTGTHVPVQN